MAGSATNAPPGSGLPSFDGTSDWLEMLPVRLEQTARQLLTMASAERSGPAAPELVTAAMQFEDAEISLEDVIECLLILERLGFLQLVTLPSKEERFVLAPIRNMPETHGKGARERGRAGAGERESASGPTFRPSGYRRPLRSLPPRFCPEHMPYGTIDDCWACARARETRSAVAQVRRDQQRDAYRDLLTDREDDDR